MDELGRYLQAAREAAGLSIDQLGRETRIPVQILEGLEHGVREGLPEPVFLRGFIQAVCRTCHADPGPALEILANEARARARLVPTEGPPSLNPRPPGAGPAEDLRVEIEKQGHVFEKKQVRIKDPLKTLGTHQVDLEIYPQVKTRLTVELVRQP